MRDDLGAARFTAGRALFIAAPTRMTPRQLECLDFIERYMAARGCAPSYREICEGLNVRSKSNVHGLVHGLIERGKITWEHKRKRRAIKIVHKACPHCGGALP